MKKVSGACPEIFFDLYDSAFWLIFWVVNFC